MLILRATQRRSWSLSERRERKVLKVESLQRKPKRVVKKAKINPRQMQT
jgi:hypothetical protein